MSLTGLLQREDYLAKVHALKVSTRITYFNRSLQVRKGVRGQLIYGYMHGLRTDCGRIRAVPRIYV